MGSSSREVQTGFQSTLSSRRATHRRRCRRWHRLISIHALLTESDRSLLQSGSKQIRDFNPRSPHGERPCRLGSPEAPQSHFNPRSPHGERLVIPVGAYIHFNFNPRSPHGERLLFSRFLRRTGRFQSTLSSRRATICRIAWTIAPKDFNPRSPHGERQRTSFSSNSSKAISIHALLTESDLGCRR